ncbi:hypothetical protein [Leucobacter sp. PH1c]|uniref:hypothetical protein n=1 Tax=Leucobacter sp. PH1c TaxID=1397278 RepID=UPI00046837D3|nr:hypothetical protein [Leucobacter sp. PH1c]
MRTFEKQKNRSRTIASINTYLQALPGEQQPITSKEQGLTVSDFDVAREEAMRPLRSTLLASYALVVSAIAFASNWVPNEQTNELSVLVILASVCLVLIAMAMPLTRTSKVAAESAARALLLRRAQAP